MSTDDDYIPMRHRKPTCDCTPTVPRAVAAHVMGCAIDQAPSRDELLESHDVIDRVARDLAAALKRVRHYVPCSGPEPPAARIIQNALERYNSLPE
jgi:hypothetical protein